MPATNPQRTAQSTEAASLQGLVGAAAATETMVHEKQREMDQRERQILLREERLAKAEEAAAEQLAERSAQNSILAEKNEALTDSARR